MSSTEDWVQVGRFAKPHGLKGEIEIVLTTNMIEERTQTGSLFCYLQDSEELLELKSARPKGDRWLFKFEGFNSRESLEPLKGCDLFAAPLESFMTHDLFGCRLVDQKGFDHGEIVAIQANPASDLVEVTSGKLVPMVFFIELSDGVANFDIPEGLFESQEN